VYCFKDDNGCRIDKTEEERKGKSDSPSVVILRQVNVLERTKLTKRSAKILGPENQW